MRRLRRAFFLPWPTLLLLILAACRARDLGLPRIPLTATSPDGKAIAFVRNHMTIDPPAQSIWLREGNAQTRIRRLTDDIDWCNVIRWSADGSTVVFLIQDARLLAVDRASARIVRDDWLVERGNYPTSRIASNLSVSPDGTTVAFQDCQRLGTGPFDATDCHDRAVQIR